MPSENTGYIAKRSKFRCFCNLNIFRKITVTYLFQTDITTIERTYCGFIPLVYTLPSQKFMGGPPKIMGGRGDSWEHKAGKPTHFIFGGKSKII